MADVTLEINEATPVNLTFTGAVPTIRSGCVMVSPSANGSPVLTTGTSKAVVRIPGEIGGMALTSVGAGVAYPSTSGKVHIQIRRVRAGVAVNMLSTEITLDHGEYDSITANHQAVIDPANRTVIEGDHLHFDVPHAGQNVLGLVISFTFQPTQ